MSKLQPFCTGCVRGTLCKSGFAQVGISLNAYATLETVHAEFDQSKK
jgi:hypothetical protein